MLTVESRSLKLISYGLWGHNPKYLVGAIKNAELAGVLYPDWTRVFYVSADVDASIIKSLRDKACVVNLMEDRADWSSMMWRFNAVNIENASVVVFRDTDSRHSVRERNAVDDWLKSEKGYHIMRDHPAHNAPIQGGMWGIRGIENMRHFSSILSDYVPEDRWGTDQDFLAKTIFPRARRDCRVHDEFFECVPFPDVRTNTAFVGESFDENDVPNHEHRIDIEAWYRISRFPEFRKRLRRSL